MVAGLRLSGLVAQKDYDRPMNEDMYEEWVEKRLDRTLSKGDIVVMDNLSSYKGPRVEKLITDDGAQLRYLKRYSADMNRMEKAYSKLKAFLRKIAERTVAGLINALDASADIFKKPLTTKDIAGGSILSSRLGSLADVLSRPPIVVISNRDSGFDHIVIGLHSAVDVVEKPGRRERLHVRMNVAVVAPQRLGQRPHARYVVPANVVQQLHPFSRQDASESVPTLERKMALLENLAAFGPAPCIYEAVRGFVFHRAADRDLHVAHLLPRKFRMSDQKSAISCSTVVKA